MKFSRILLIFGIVAILSIFAVSTTFAACASTEKLTQYKGSFSSNLNKKISNIEQISAFKNNNSKEYYKINIKKNYQNRYKIRSVSVKYSLIDNETHEIINFFYKNYTGKNKNSLKINILDKDNILLIRLLLIIILKERLKMKVFIIIIMICHLLDIGLVKRLLLN